jgi:very-short-patch-repair endonuclease
MYACHQWMLHLVADVKVHQKIGNYSVDVFVPDWKAALEYQGGQHYQQSWRGDVQGYCCVDK